MLVHEYFHETRVLIVPVIDLMGGRVVHARRGDRSNYRPLQSVLTPSSEPLEVVRALLDFAPFPVIYAADLDAILHRGQHAALLRQIGERFHPLNIWLDAGFGEPRELEPWRDADGIVPVLGSESLRSASDLPALLAVVPHALLSLDTRDELVLGPTALFAQPQSWPQRVIVMTLDRVGAGSGPAYTRLQTIAAQAPGKQLIAAGGVRDVADLETLERMGVHAALIASALHDGTLDRAALKRFLNAD
jgi:phosphoribosylformimino-5-aminoimidazole carboxamide ribotide isomerase